MCMCTGECNYAFLDMRACRCVYAMPIYLWHTYVQYMPEVANAVALQRGGRSHDSRNYIGIQQNVLSIAT